ncbi:tyrosine-type recombinase/integrase [Silvimonas amylolytica]|uniref:Integrase n=1 Tax=Silvimonas amylolytica TaxID=449663 RepID=A0ABQ2PTK9_9NEIS|nr:tyrosine-type recombinase/integrase [Silvimonas amylolytica]GGP28312.1 integrase [Silvimonas amylolytica]
MSELKDTKARTISPETGPMSHGGVTGLRLIPSGPKGRGKWMLRYISPLTGKRRDAGLGAYPEVGIATAREKADAMRKQLAAGIDPLDARKTEAATPKVPTFEAAARTLHAELVPGWKNAKHGQQWINTLTRYAFPCIGALALDAITPRHIADVLRPIWLDRAETASRTKQRMHAVMAWGWAHGYVAANPVDVVDYLLPQQAGKAARVQHQPAMPWRDVPAWVDKHLHGAGRGDVTRVMLEFLILTAARSGEVRGATWAEIDLGSAQWTIPAERMKAKIQHVVPLSDRALALLHHQQGQHDTLVFPSPRDQVPLSDMVLTAFLRRVAAPSGTAGRVATAHGFRSSFRDWASAQRYDRDLAEMALAHTVSNKVESAYNRERLVELRQPMMQAWADFLGGRSADVVAHNVVPMRGVA